MDVLNHHIQPANQNRVADPRTNVYLSLYLVIFGFFIVLVNASEISEPKSSAAIASVKETFFQDNTLGTEAPFAEDTRLSPARQVIDNVEGELAASFTTAQFTQGQDGKELRVVVDADALFYPNTAAIKPAAREAFVRLGEILSVRSVRESIFLAVPRLESLSDRNSAVSASNLRRAKTLAVLIAEGNVLAPSVFAGYTRQAAQSIVLVIRTQDRAETRSRRGIGP